MYTKKQTRRSRQANNRSKQLEMLPVPDFNPKIPAKDTLEYQALILMLNGNKITHRDFDNETNSWRLAAYILKLRKLGWPVEDNEITITSSKKPIIRHIKQYYLSKEIIEQAKRARWIYE